MSKSELSSLTPSGRITLIQLDLNPININSIFYFHPYPADDLIFNANTYRAAGLILSGFEIKVNTLPEPKISIGSTPTLRTLLDQYNGLRGAVVCRIVTMEKYLNLPADNAYILDDQSFIISHISEESKISFTLELRSVFDFGNDKFPGGIFLRKDYPGIGLVKR